MHPRRPSRPSTRLPSALVAAAALWLALAGAAAAHAELVSSDPPGGAVLTAPPAAVVARYSEAIDPGRSSILVLDAGGHPMARGGVDASDPTHTTMRVILPALAAGTYTVRWTTVTPDDNGVERGTFTFTVAPGVTPTPSTTSSPARPSAASPAPAAPGPAESPTPVAAAPSGASSDLSTTLLPIVAAVAVVVLLAGGIALRRRSP